MRCFILIVFLNIHLFCSGITAPPLIKKICLNNNDSSIEISWTIPNDTCLSFKHYTICAQQNLGSFKIYKIVINYNTNNANFKLPNLDPGWGFKIYAVSDCSLTDSLGSDIQTIDLQKPDPTELDSVSFNIITQNLELGWKKSPSYDTKGYRIYHYNNNINDSIFQVANITNTTLNKYNKANPIQTTIAVYDSCNLYSAISNPHKAVYLNGTLDTCNKTIDFKWNNYLGWNNITQWLMYSNDGISFYKDSVLNLSTSCLYTKVKLGEKKCFYIRTINNTNQFTSSSNMLCFQTNPFPLVNDLNINYVTVNGNDIDIDYGFTFKTGIDSILIEKSISNSNTFIPFWQSKNNLNSQTIKDNQVNINNTRYFYKVTLYNTCRKKIIESQISSNILLKHSVSDNNIAEWNTYEKWKEGLLSQNMMQNLGFTWNTYKNLSLVDTKNSIILNNEDSVCVIIRSESNNNYISNSNKICFYKTVENKFPDLINPNSENNRFSLLGNNYKELGASLEIFNRWGNLVYRTENLKEGWLIPNNYSNEYFMYICSYTDLNNIKQIKKGIFYIIK